MRRIRLVGHGPDGSTTHTNQWGRASLRLSCDVLTVGEVADRLGIASMAATDDHWAVELEPYGDAAIDDHLGHVKRFLAENLEALRALAGKTDITMHLRTTPQACRDGVALDVELIGMLGSIRAHLLIDPGTI